MARQYLLGNEALAHAALEGGVGFAAGYPGTPSSEVIDLLRAERPEGVHVEWSTNEKVAFENALAASWCGVRALFTTKHVGLNVAADPLMTSAYTGVTGGFVVFSADDPFAHSSQNEQDSRLYAAMAGLPCLDPTTIEEAHAMLRDAFALSEEVQLPVIVRPTTRICHSKADVELGPVPAPQTEAVFHRDPRQYVVIPAHTRVLHHRLNEKQPRLRERLLPYNTGEIRGRRAVVASGIAASYVREVLPDDVSLFTVRAYPLDPEQLHCFCLEHEEVLVIEEGAPVVEEQVRQAAGCVRVFGKRTGHVPAEGELSPTVVRGALAKAGYTDVSPAPLRPEEGIPPRPPILCAGCPHRAVFHAMRRVFRDAVFPSDIGCYTLGLQLGAVDTTICMGASITVASGIALTAGGDVVATIGDSTFLHTGLPGLVNAVYNGAEMVLVILDNRTTAMTGHQPNRRGHAEGLARGALPGVRRDLGRDGGPVRHDGAPRDPPRGEGPVRGPRGDREEALRDQRTAGEGRPPTALGGPVGLQRLPDLPPLRLPRHGLRGRDGHCHGALLGLRGLCHPLPAGRDRPGRATAGEGR